MCRSRGAIAALRAALGPAFCWRITRILGSPFDISSRSSGVASLEPSSTAITSKESVVWAVTERIASPTVSAAL